MTKIEWTEKTWDPIVGCSIVSPGCTNCYAMKMAARLEAIGSGATHRVVGIKTVNVGLNHYAGTTKRVNGNPVWTGKIALAPDRVLIEPLKRKKPTMYFVNSMSDLFHESVPDAWIDRVFAVMALTPQHTYQVLTKRAARMRNYVVHLYETDYGIERLVEAAVNVSGSPCAAHVEDVTPPLPNLWLGVSVERPQELPRVLDLVQTPSAVHFVSAEPLLAAVDFQAVPLEDGYYDALTGASWIRDDLGHHVTVDGPNWAHLDWVICGGESGPGARPMQREWAESIVRQCKSAGVAVFVKQLGSAYADEKNGIAGAALNVSADVSSLISRRLRDRKGGDMSEWPEALRVREMPRSGSAPVEAIELQERGNANIELG